MFLYLNRLLVFRSSHLHTEETHGTGRVQEMGNGRRVGGWIKGERWGQIKAWCRFRISEECRGGFVVKLDCCCYLLLPLLPLPAAALFNVFFFEGIIALSCQILYALIKPKQKTAKALVFSASRRSVFKAEHTHPHSFLRVRLLLRLLFLPFMQ